MEKVELSYKSYNPSLAPLLKKIKEDKEITKYLSFSQTDSKFIFLNGIFIGFCKLFPLDEEDFLEYEIEIAILEEHRGKGFSSLVLKDLGLHLFHRSDVCHAIHLSIEKTNKSSIRMALKNGYVFNASKTEELKKYGDTHTLVFTKKNYLLENVNKEEPKKAVS